MKDPRDLPPLLDVDPHLVELLGVARGTAYRLVKSGEVPSVKLGRLIKIPRDRLLAHLGLIDGDDGGEVVSLRDTA